MLWTMGMQAIQRRRVFSSPLLALAAGALLLLAGCATGGAGYGGGRGGTRWQRSPVLYPNAHYHEVGPEVADMDIHGCMYRAETGVGNKSTAGTVAGNTVGGAAAGAVLGAIGGAIVGNPGTGAALGAAVGGTSGLAKGTMDSRNNDPTFQGFVERCLAERGYEVIGWK